MMRVLSVGLAAVIVGSSASSFAEDWAQFRGPNAAGVAKNAKNLPAKFSLEENVLWSAEVGEGIACPIVVNGKAIATAMLDDQTFAVFCFDSATGKELWHQEYDTGPTPPITPPNTHASSTPTSDGERVYVYFSTIGMMALDINSGQLVWKQGMPLPFYLLGWGAASSPIIYKDLGIFNQDDDLAPFLIAYDRRTGEVRWKTERPEMLGGYAVPVVCKANGREDIVVAGSGKLKGYEPDSGAELWTCNTLLRTVMTTPAVYKDKIYVSIQSYGDTDRVLKFALLQWKDTNQDNKLDKEEVEEAFWKKFDKGDVNKDGFLIDDEISIAFQAPTNMVGGGNTIQAVRGGGTGDVTKSHLVWNIDNKSPSNIASPLVADGRVFVVKKGGISASFDAENGAMVWEKKRIRNFGNYYASPIAGDGKIYVQGENGFLVVLKQGPKPEILSKNDMGDSCIATPAIADNRIYVRTLQKLYCFAVDSN